MRITDGSGAVGRGEALTQPASGCRAPGVGRWASGAGRRESGVAEQSQRPRHFTSSASLRWPGANIISNSPLLIVCFFFYYYFFTVVWPSSSYFFLFCFFVHSFWFHVTFIIDLSLYGLCLIGKWTFFIIDGFETVESVKLTNIFNILVLFQIDMQYDLTVYWILNCLIDGWVTEPITNWL